MKGRRTIQRFLRHLATLHDHLCPRQVLGLRMGLHVAELFELKLPQADKRLMALVETDGCFADGVAVATGCWLGRRTMRLMDHGKIAATFVDTSNGRSVRMRPTHESRDRAMAIVPTTPSRWHAYLRAYQSMPVRELLDVQPVTLTLDLRALISRPDARTACARCGEEIINTRERVCDGQPVCRSCAGDTYYRTGCISGA